MFIMTLAILVLTLILVLPRLFMIAEEYKDNRNFSKAFNHGDSRLKSIKDAIVTTSRK
jgi:hypothetical protein